MSVRLALIACILLIGAVLASSVLADDEHGENACTGQSWSQETGPNEFWWKVVTTCNDDVASEVAHSIRLEYYDWDDNTWRTSLLIFSGSRLWVDFYATSRVRTVPDFHGMACYRIRTYHRIIEWWKDMYSDGTSYSTEQCY